MGCDIHVYVEQRVAGAWVPVSPPASSGENKSDIGQFGWYRANWPDRHMHKWNFPRCYSLFTVLSGVRNDCPLNSPIKDCPYNLPEDVSEIVRQAHQNDGGDAHSASFYTLKELQDHDWNTLFYEVGVVSVEEAIQIKQTGEPPRNWCGWRGGSEIMLWDSQTSKLLDTDCKLFSKELSAEQIQEWAKTVKNPMVQMVWSHSQKEELSWFTDKLFQELAKIAAPEDVRLVFWYDN